MGSLLTPELAGGTDAIRIGDEAAVSAIREAVRARGNEIGMDRVRTESLAAATSEIGHNQLRHAGGGEMLARTIQRAGVPGVEVLARDAGSGIADPTLALRGRSAPAAGSAGLGVGVSAAHRLADELDVDIRWGAGTTIAARKFATPLPRSEVAILARPCAGETVIGDDACFVRRGGGLLLAVADGLGHGPPAQEASRRAIAAVLRAVSTSPRDLLEICQPALAGTRGAVMSVVFIPEAGTELLHAGVGNIACHLYRNRAATRFAGVAGVVGQVRSSARVQDERSALGGRHVLLMHSDGLPSRIDLSQEAALLREPPLVIAHRLMADHARPDDDVLVLVATG
jgi:anti-sigma regulatory factor (Ser/Thr protein kinase)